MDRNIIAIHRDYADHEAAAAAACYEAAHLAGHTEDHADQCDDGSHACPACPFARPDYLVAKNAAVQCNKESLK